MVAQKQFNNKQKKKQQQTPATTKTPHIQKPQNYQNN